MADKIDIIHPVFLNYIEWRRNGVLEHAWTDRSSATGEHTPDYPPPDVRAVIALLIAPELGDLETDAARWRALVTTFGPESDVSTPHKPHVMILQIDVEGCEVWVDGRCDFKATLERALDDEISRIAANAARALLAKSSPDRGGVT